MGRLIPAGTGFEWYRHVWIPAGSLSRRSRKAAQAEATAPTPIQPAEDDLELDREIEYAFDTDGLPRRSA